MKFLLILYVCVCIINLNADAMYNGDYHPITDFPYTAQIQTLIPGGQKYCSAAILSTDWLISAAHCVSWVRSNADTQIITGSSATLSGGKLINITKIFVPGGHDYIQSNDDVCLMKLERSIEFNEYQQPIQIARKCPKVGNNVTVTGYGSHHHGVFGSVLRATRVPIIENKYCKDIMEKFYIVSVTDDQFCTSTEEVELCPGDSGGPAVFNNQLIGVLSFGCDNHRLIPSGFTKLANYYDWIMELTGLKYDN